MTVTFLDLVDLASERLGATVVAANDEFFAPKDNLIKWQAPIWREHEYTERGKWMDGWETRRRRDVTTTDHDWCIVRLGVAGRVRGVDVDTAHFKGNAPEACAVDLCVQPRVPSVAELERADWREVVSRTPLTGDSHNLFGIDGVHATHARLRVFPDGGVARFRVYGEVVADWDRLRRGEVDLASVDHGGVVVACSDMFFGSRQNLIMPGEPRDMRDGWETRRRRGSGHDWAVIRLGTAGTISRVEVDTRHFKGNAPGACSLEACALGLDGIEPSWEARASLPWRDLLPRTPLQPHTRHTFEAEVNQVGGATHVRFNIYPDGGVARLRLFGRPA